MVCSPQTQLTQCLLPALQQNCSIFWELMRWGMCHIKLRTGQWRSTRSPAARLPLCSGLMCCHPKTINISWSMNLKHVQSEWSQPNTKCQWLWRSALLLCLHQLWYNFLVSNTYVFVFFLSRWILRIRTFDVWRLFMSQVRPRLSVNTGSSEVSDWAIQHVIV
jgi:hypothetical protein